MPPAHEQFRRASYLAAHRQLHQESCAFRKPDSAPTPACMKPETDGALAWSAPQVLTACERGRSQRRTVTGPSAVAGTVLTPWHRLDSSHPSQGPRSGGCAFQVQRQPHYPARTYLLLPWRRPLPSLVPALASRLPAEHLRRARGRFPKEPTPTDLHVCQVVNVVVSSAHT